MKNLLSWFNTFRSSYADKITHSALGYVGADLLADGIGLQLWMAALAIIIVQIAWELISRNNTFKESALDTLATASGVALRAMV